MNIEIEAKVKIDDLQTVADRVRELGGELIGDFTQKDTFFTDKKRKLIKSGCGLRIRCQTSSQADEVFVTFKGPKEKGPYKIRPESEVSVGNAKTMRAIFNGLGYEKLIVVEKRRQMWGFGGCEVCLDDVKLLGTFVEVEGPTAQDVEAVMDKLGLGRLEHINKGYAKMIRKKLKHTSE